MRVLLLTGKGGVGKTTTAAATASLAAARGQKVLVVSTDPAHSLGDAFGVALGAEPTEVDPGLEAVQVDGQAAFERSWRLLQQTLATALVRLGVDGLQAEQLTVLPGADEVLALLALREHAASGRYDAIVVDCAPTGETLRLLALPEALAWYVDHAFPAHRRALRALRPVLSRVNGPALPSEDVLEAVLRLHHELLEVRALLTGPQASVRLVLTPEAVVLAEARRTLTALALYGYRVDSLVCNRVFPTSTDPFTAGWVAAQTHHLEQVRRDAGPLPVRVAPYLPVEPVGLPALLALGEELYADDEPLAPPAAGEELLRVERTTDGFALSLALPHAERGDVELVRTGDDLVVTVGGHRRVHALPSVLRRCTVAGALLQDARLVVRFEPDPALWMRTP